jgi:hypothetical protein
MLKEYFCKQDLRKIKPHNHTLSLRKTPQKEFNPRNAALGPWGRRGWPKFDGLAGSLGRGRGWEGSRGCGGRLVCGFGADRAAGERHGGDRRRTSLELGFR